MEKYLTLSSINEGMKTSIYTIIYIVAMTLMLASCGKKAAYEGERKRTIAVSIEPQRALAEAIAGDRFDVVTVLERGANPETYEPSMSRRIDVDRSEAYLTIGAFNFEDMIIESDGQELKVYNSAAGIEPVKGTHSHGHEGYEHHGDDADPHVWSSYINARIISRNIANALSELDPEYAEVYRSRLDSLCAVIDKAENTFADKIASAQSKSFLIWHPSLSYIARDYGLHQIAVGQESKEISPRKLREIIDHAEADSVKVFFFQREFDSRQAETISGRIGTRLVTIDPLAYDWMEQLNMIADELAK